MSWYQSSAPLLGQGYTWEQLQVGMQFRTFRRTITEADLVTFIGCTGMLEAIFIEADYPGAAISGRPVPAALTYAIIEGFILQTMIQGTGLVMLALQQTIEAPVRVGDTIGAVVEVTAISPTSSKGRAVVTSRIAVFNQREERVMTYEATRLLAGTTTSATASMIASASSR